MTLLSICQAVADEIDATRPSTIVGNSAPDVQKLYRFINRAGNYLMKLVDWQALRGEQTFTALGQETQTSILPSDFDRVISETFWDRTNRALVSGPISPVQWAGLKANGYNDTGNRKFALRGSAVIVIPVPSGGESYAFEYISTKWAASSGGTAQTSMTADTDVARIDEELIIRAVKVLYLDGEGLPSSSALADFEDFLDTIVRNDQPRSRVMVSGDIFSGGRHFSGAPVANGDGSVI